MNVNTSIITFLLSLCFTVGHAQNYQAEYLVQYDNFTEKNDSVDVKSEEWIPPVQLKIKYKLLANEHFIRVKMKTMEVKTIFDGELTANNSNKEIIINLKDTLSYSVNKDTIQNFKYYKTTDQQQARTQGCKSMSLTGDKASHKVKICDSIPPFITPLVFVAGASGGITSMKSPNQNMKLIDFKATDTQMPDFSAYFKE